MDKYHEILNKITGGNIRMREVFHCNTCKAKIFCTHDKVTEEECREIQRVHETLKGIELPNIDEDTDELPFI